MPSRAPALPRVLLVSIVATLGLVVVVPASPAAQSLSPQAVSGEPWYWTGVSTVAASPSSPAATARVQGEALAAMSDDSVLVAGYFSHQAVVPTGPGVDDSIVLTASGEFDILLAHLDTSTGYFTWAQRAGGTGSDQAYAVAVSRDDTAIITGFIRGTSQFPTGPNADDSIVLTSIGDQDIFVAAIDTDTGYFTWAQRAGGAETPGPPGYSQDVGQGLATGRDDTIVVTGEFEGTATFPSGPVASLSLTSSGGTDVFIAAVDPATGYFTWAQRAGGSLPDEGLAVALTSAGRPIITGRVSDTAWFPTAADDSITVTAASSDVFVAAINADDSYFDWVQIAGGAGLDNGYGLSVTADDTPLVTGRFINAASFPTAADDSITLTGSGIDVFVAALNADDSYFAWAQRATGPDTSEGLSISLTTSGAPVVTGIFKDALSFPTGPGPDDSVILASSGNYDAFVAGLDPGSGYFTWSQQAGSTSTSFTGRDAAGRSVGMLGDDTAIVAGNFAATASFPSGPSTTITRTAQPGGAAANLFLGMIGPYAPQPPPPPPPPPPPVFPPSAPSQVIAQPGDAAASIAWTAPSSAGSFPITTYQVQVLPGGSSCMVAAPTLGCEVLGLANGETYTASVRALNGAGWGPFSAASEPFTPAGPVVRSITITGSRGEVRGRSGVIVDGVTTDLAGQEVLPRVRLAGQGRYVTGRSVTISDEGSFTWQRRTGKTAYVYFQDDSVRSNRVAIPAR